MRPKQGGENKEVGNEVCDDAYAHQNIVCTFNSRSCLSQQDKDFCKEPLRN
jgi:hypothetical protein